MKCTSTGRKCDGYETPSPPPPQRNTCLRLPYVYSQTLQYSGNTRETRSFQFFYERTVPSLAGLCGSEFWSGLVLRVSQHETAVYHALIALGSLHENFENGHWLSQRGIDTFAVQQYVSAIRALLGSSNSSPCVSSGLPAGSPRSLTVDVCLISCILFIFIEVGVASLSLSSIQLIVIDNVRSLRVGRQSCPKWDENSQGRSRGPLVRDLPPPVLEAIDSHQLGNGPLAEDPQPPPRSSSDLGTSICVPYTVDD